MDPGIGSNELLADRVIPKAEINAPHDPLGYCVKVDTSSQHLIAVILQQLKKTREAINLAHDDEVEPVSGEYL